MIESLYDQDLHEFQLHFLSILRDGSVYALLMKFAQMYGPQSCVLFVLVCITIWRKELSSNHVYHSSIRPRSVSRSSRRHRREGYKTDHTSMTISSQHRHVHELSSVLDAVGFSFSFEPFLAVIYTVFKQGLHLDYSEYNSTTSIIYDLAKYVWYAVNGYIFATCIARSPSMQDLISNSDLSEDNAFRAEQCDSLDENKKVFAIMDADKSPIHDLPVGIQVHLFSFLSPRDLCEFSCVSTHCAMLTDDHHCPSSQLIYGDSTAALIWNNILLRDFNAVLNWNIAQKAFERSLAKIGISFEGTIIEFLTSTHFPNHRSRKDFYFQFSESWINWSLAGENSEERCLVGLHGSILNMSKFLHSHPGTPETLLMQGGRDATKYFEDIGHSSSARNVALDCVLINRNNLYHEIDFFVDELIDPTPFPMQRSTPWKIGNIKRVRNCIEKEYKREIQTIQHWLHSRINSVNVIGNEVHPFFDPFSDSWEWWYTSWEGMRPVFVSTNH